MKSRSGDAVRRLGAYVDRQIEDLEHSLAKAIRRGKPKPIHNARVAARRLAAAMDLLKPIAKRKPRKRLKKAATRVRKSLGSVRDIDAMYETLERLRPIATVKRVIEPTLDRERKHRLTKIDAAMPSRPFKRTRVADLTSDATDAAVHACIREAAYAALHAIADAFASSRESKALHSARIAAKRLRYALEVGREVGLSLNRTLVDRATRLQSELGAWHDATVLAAFLTEHVGDARSIESDGTSAAAREHFVDRVKSSASNAAKRCRAHWHIHGNAFGKALRAALPVAIKRSRTDHDPPG